MGVHGRRFFVFSLPFPRMAKRTLREPRTPRTPWALRDVSVPFPLESGRYRKRRDRTKVRSVGSHKPRGGGCGPLSTLPTLGLFSPTRPPRSHVPSTRWSWTPQRCLPVLEPFSPIIVVAWAGGGGSFRGTSLKVLDHDECPFGELGFTGASGRCGTFVYTPSNVRV